MAPFHQCYFQQQQEVVVADEKIPHFFLMKIVEHLVAKMTNIFPHPY